MPTPLLDNRQLGPDIARANLLVNGGFEWWQRGPGAFTGSSVFGADAWKYNLGSGSTISWSRVATSSVDANRTGYCAGFTYTHAAGGAGELLQYPNDLLPEVRGKTVSLSMRVWCNAASAVTIGVYDSVNGWRWGSYHPGNSAFQTMTITVPIATGSNTLAVGMHFYGPSCTAYVDDAMLVIGLQPCDYVPMHSADDFARCLRYYQRLQPGAGGIYYFVGSDASTTQAYLMAVLQPQMAINPTLTVGTPSDWSLVNETFSASYVPSSFALSNSNRTCALIGVAHAAASNAGTVRYLMSANANAWLAFEANP